MALSHASRPADRREQILSEALRLFVEHGIQNVTTRKIAQAVGISQPSLYAHFKGRDDIAIELSQRAFAQLRGRMTHAAKFQGTPYERLYRMGQEYVAFGLEHSAAYRVAFMLERANLQATDQTAIHEAGMQGFELLHDLFKEIRNSEDEQTAALAQSAWASMHGLVSLVLARAEFPWVERDKLIHVHIDRVCQHAFG
jgi:AcrR family transcriptional regulator